MSWTKRIGMAARRVVLGLGAGAGMAAATALVWAQASQPIPRAHIYPSVDAAPGEIRAALAQARQEHKRVILDFGGDWCGDCQVLNYYLHQSPNKELLDKYYILVDVNVGHIDQNIDIANRYGVPLRKGVPALAVLRSDGTVVYAQKSGEFEDFRNNKPTDLTAFLERWKGTE